MRELGDHLLEDTECAQIKKGIFVRTSGLLQQIYTDRIDAVMVTGCDEASAVGGKIVSVLCEVDRAKAELRTGQGKLGIESLRVGDAYLCFEAGRTWYRDGFWALGVLILDKTRLRVLEARSALECCGVSDFSYQCDAVFFKGSFAVQNGVRLRFGHLFSGELKTPSTPMFEPALNNPRSSEKRVSDCIEVMLSLDALPPTMRRIISSPKPQLLVIPLWDGVGNGFRSMEDAHTAWRSLGKNTKRKLWPEICSAESPSTLEGLLLASMSQKGSRVVCGVTREHGGAGKSYCAFRAAKTIFKTGLVLTPTNSLRTSFTDMPSGWSV